MALNKTLLVCTMGHNTLGVVEEGDDVGHFFNGCEMLPKIWLRKGLKNEHRGLCFIWTMLETKREERHTTVLREGYFVGTWDIRINLKTTGKSWLYGRGLHSLHHGISLQGDMGQEKTRTLDLCYLVLPHIL